MSGAPRIEATDDLAACAALRRAVFIDEQGIAEADEWDGLDADCTHLLARGADGAPLGMARLHVADGIGHVGRVCVLAQARGTGLGAALMRAAVTQLAAQGAREVELGAQVHAIGFYEGLGFAAEGPVYDDAGIPHRLMRRRLRGRD